MTEEREPGSAIRAIVSKAVRDEDFRELLLRDPRSGVTEALGVEVPAEITVHVHENSATDVHVVLPPPVVLSAQRPLTDEDLQTVAGSPMMRPVEATFSMCTNTFC
jgi:hypothetical protein